MPKTFGVPGNYVFAESRRKNLRFFLILICAVAFVSYFAGLSTGLSLAHLPILSFLCLILVALLMALAKRRISLILDDLQTAGIAFRKGVEGEALTADALSDLPDTFSVFHDLTHPSIGGNIDHIVVGPTGVFALETKNWKGHVNFSDQGEITVDGTYDHTKDGKAILGRALTLKKKIEALSNISTFVQAVMVFPLASLKDESGPRCNLHIQTLQTLEGYLKRPSSRILTSQQVATITGDLQALFKLAAPQAN